MLHSAMLLPLYHAAVASALIRAVSGSQDGHQYFASLVLLAYGKACGRPSRITHNVAAVWLLLLLLLLLLLCLRAAAAAATAAAAVFVSAVAAAADAAAVEVAAVVADAAPAAAAVSSGL